MRNTGPTYIRFDNNNDNNNNNNYNIIIIIIIIDIITIIIIGLDAHDRGFWDRQGSAFFDVKVFHANADFYKDLTIQQLYRKHEDEKRLYANRVLEVEQGTFTPLLFITTGGMAVECKRFHSRLAELVAIGHFRVHLRLHFKAKLSAKSLL